jgi:O-antigen ligase
LVVLLFDCFLMGGASRVDVLSLVILQPLAVVCTGIFLIFGRDIRWDAIKVPLLLLAALAAIMAVQIIPLPPDLWTALPGHGQFASSARVIDMDQPWRPISVTPDLTIDSLVSLSVPLAVLIGFASLPVERTRSLLPYLVAGVTLSAVVGLAQLASGGRGPLYLYDVTNMGSSVGLFANRNHQAVLLAMGWPLLAVWATRRSDRLTGGVRLLIAMALALFFIPMVLVIGSRAGLVLAVVGVVAAFLIQKRGDLTLRRFERWKIAVAAAGATAVIAVITAAIVFSRDEALARTSATALADETRLTHLPVLWRILVDFFPVGTGFGSFDPVFRVYEPVAILAPQYFNHAHNDLLELILVGGLPAALLLAVFLVWLAKQAVRVVRARHGDSSLTFARLGLAMFVILLLSSLVDYPLRTPLLAALFAIGCGWLCDHPVGKHGERTAVDHENALPAGG